ncbi:MAG: TonB-dependent receptor [Pseudomonadota bacterium]
MRRHSVSTITLMILCLSGLSLAETGGKKDPLVTMDEVVVTGTRFEQKTEKIPAQVAVISAGEIRASGARSVPEVLRNLGGVMVRDLNGNGNNQIVDMGGFGASADRHVAVVINGRRVNPIDQSGVRWTLIPVENIERIEVLYGSGSVLYGDNAMGGVINIITKEWSGVQQVEAEGAIGNQDTMKGQVRVDFGKTPLGVQLDFSTYTTDGYRERSETDRRHFHGKITSDVTDEVTLFFEMDAGKADFHFPGSLAEAQQDHDRKQAVNLEDEGKDQDISAVMGLRADWGEKGRWNFTFSHRNEDRESDLASWWSYMDFDVSTTGVNSQFILEKPWAGHDNRLTLGMDFYDTEYDAYRGPFKSARTNHYDHSKTTLAGYIQDEFNLTEALLLNAGLRYEKPWIDLSSAIGGSLTEDTYDEGEWAMNLGIAYSFQPQSKIYGRIYRSFRYPVVDEYTSLFTGAINSELKQETSIGYEAGIRFAISPQFVSNLRVFWMDVDDEIAWNSLTNRNENLDETRHRGGEVGFRYQAISKLTLFAGGAYTNAEFAKGANKGKNIPLVPEWTANTGVEYLFPFGLKTRVQYNFVSERYFGDDLENAQKKMSDYQTVDMYLSYRYKILEVFFNATNIFGEKYTDFAFYSAFANSFNYYPMPEAVYMGGVKITF